MRPGWPVLRKLWHIETTIFKKFMTNLRKWKKLTHVPHFPTSTVTPKSYGDKTQMSFVREACVAFFPTWSLNFQIADTCTHCVPIFLKSNPNAVIRKTLRFVTTTYFPNVRSLRLKWIKEWLQLYFGGGGLISSTLMLSLINLHKVKYLIAALFVWFQHMICPIGCIVLSQIYNSFPLRFDLCGWL